MPALKNLSGTLPVSAAVSSISHNLMPTRHLLADAGMYFIAKHLQSAPIAPNAVETSFADTRGFVVIQNQQALGSAGKRIYLDFMRLLLSGTAPTATLLLHFLLKRSSASREPTTAANKTLLTPINMTSGTPAQALSSIARVMTYANAGAMTIPASAGGDPELVHVQIPTGLGVTGDEYLVRFGMENSFQAPVNLTAVRVTTIPGRYGADVPEPIVIEPGEWLVIHRWWAAEATNAPTFEVSLGWWEA